MDLEGLLDRGEPEPRPERRGWLVAKILVLTVAATAIGGAVLVLVLYGAALAGLVVWQDVWEGF